VNVRLIAVDLREEDRIHAKLSFKGQVAPPTTYRPILPVSQFKAQGDVSVHRGSLSAVQFVIVLLNVANHPAIKD
jgi:hypothetical protein